VLLILEKMGFFDSTTTITHIEKTGLIAEAETTTLPPETTTKKNKKSKKKKKSTSTTKKQG